MIVSDDTVSKALAYLSEDPHPLALAQANALTAERKRDETFADLFLATTGTAKERESWVEVDPAFKAASTEVIEAQKETLRHKRRTDAAEKIISVWQTENANARAAERVR